MTPLISTSGAWKAVAEILPGTKKADAGCVEAAPASAI